MTIVIGYRTPTGTIVAADSQGTCGASAVFGTRKIFDLGHFVVALSGSYRLRALLETHRKEWCRWRDPQKIANALRDAIRKDEWTLEEDKGGGPKTIGSSLLFAAKSGKGLWAMDCDCTVEEIPVGHFVTLGSGCDHATGALAALRDLPWSPERVVRKAMEVTCRHNAYCGGEIHVRCLNGAD